MQKHLFSLLHKSQCKKGRLYDIALNVRAKKKKVPKLRIEFYEENKEFYFLLFMFY